MHIPDGYLSPSSCACLYAGAAPFWYLALQRVKREFSTRTIPLLSLFAAFSFVIMMFNLPLPGGTTGHAIGIGMATIVLGPWVSIVAISMALLVQALFFGDGGITAFGANCFNMAIVGSLAAFAVYRVLAYGAEVTSRRRVFAAGLAGYAAINLAALCAAVEFGVQPLWFHDASGAPLYAPYPLDISIPAMMIGHLTFAGLAEMILSAGIVAYLQRTDSQMLRLTAPDAPETTAEIGRSGSTAAGLHSPRLWLALGLLLVLTPLGILSVGAAWGEWRAEDFTSALGRQHMAAASQNHLPPSHPPKGLERLSSVWKAPLSGYSTPLIRNAYVGYISSAAAGVGLIILLCLIVRGLSPQFARQSSLTRHGRRRHSFVEGTIERILGALRKAVFAEDMANSKGFLQGLDARVKLAGITVLIAATVSVHRVEILAALFAASILLAMSSNVSLRFLATRIWVAVLTFTGLIALPALFLTPGQTVYHLPVVHWAVTSQGLTTAVRLIMRAETAATLSLLLVLSTMWHHLLRALRVFRIPAVVVMVLETSYRYVFLLLQTTQNMFESRQTRLIGYLSPLEQRRFMSATAGVLLDKSLQLSGEVHSAMLARGFRGDIRLLDEPAMKPADWIQLAGFFVFAALAIWIGS